MSKDKLSNEELLSTIEKNSKLSTAQISTMLEKDAETIETAIKTLEKENIILGYRTIINWEKTNKEFVTAFIEVKISPQRGEGFDRIAQRISKFDEVKSVYLMSGSYDLAVIIEGRTLKEVSLFVTQKLATLEFVLSTTTHFVLKKYKDNGILFSEKEKDTREVITP